VKALINTNPEIYYPLAVDVLLGVEYNDNI